MVLMLAGGSSTGSVGSVMVRTSMDGDLDMMPAGAGCTWKTGGGLVLTSATPPASLSAGVGVMPIGGDTAPLPFV
jgi:hypothetical protein